MAKFCTQCGAQIIEGEQHICNVQPVVTTPSTKSTDFMSVLKNQLDAFAKDFLGWISGNKQNVNAITSVVFAVAAYLLNSLFFVFMFVVVANKLTGGLDSFSSLGGGISFWYGVLVLIVAYITTMVLDIIKNAVNGQQINLVNGLSHASTTSLLCSVTLFIGGLFSLMVWWFGMPFVLMAIVLRVKSYWDSVVSMIKSKNAIVNKCIVSVIIAVILSLGFVITGSCIKEYISNLLSSIMGGLF